MKIVLEVVEIRWNDFGKEIPSYFQNESVTLICCKLIVMNKKLIIKAFEKAKKNEESKGIKAPSKNQLSIILSGFITNEMNFPFGERSLKNYYDEALRKADTNEDINISQLKVVVGLCKYLGFENYEDYIFKNIMGHENTQSEEVIYDINSNKGKSIITVNPKDKKLFAWISTASAANKLLLIIVASVIISAGVTTLYLNLDQPRWMVWQDHQYIEVNFDVKTYKVNQMKLYKEERIESFKKIKTDSSTVFFNKDGSVNVWYGKNNKKELEYFTDLGLHPGTGKTLKPITRYMINTHIYNK